MVTYNKLTHENIDAINSRAVSKADGCYTFRGIMYRVQRGHVTHYACNSEIIERCGHFHVCVGAYKTDTEGLKLLRGI